jgi:3-hydroxyacyl-CoA dehydrogenase
MERRTTNEVFVIGTGKTARDIGLFLCSRGYAVTWLSRDEARLSEVEAFVSKKIRRLASVGGDDSTQGSFWFALFGSHDLPRPDMVIESGREALETKRASVSMLSPLFKDDTLLFSNSSSILPGDIHPDAVGLHCFFPLALCEFAEVILPKECGADLCARVEAQVRDLGLSFVVQDATNAFTLNRLMLPLMAEVFRRFSLGESFDGLDEASRSPLLSRGQVSAMDDIGLDVLAASVDNYVNRMPEPNAADYRFLSTSLNALVSAGILGKKNRTTLLKTPRDVLESAIGNPPGFCESPAQTDELKADLYALFINTCLGFVDNGDIDPESLSLALASIFGSDLTPGEALANAGSKTVHNRLDALYTETGISYFRPSRLLTKGGEE